MEVFLSPVTDPRLNLALEEFFLEEYQGDGCLVYRNAACLVLGKNQNPYREFNVSTCKNQSIPIFRRISGGGAVYHDLGNINTAFFGERHIPAEGLYERYSQPALAFLESKGLGVKRDGRNGLELDNKKISGSAQALKRNRFLHHATLLYSSNLSLLARSLSPNHFIVKGRGIASVRSPVVNVQPHLENPSPVEAFVEDWAHFLCDYFDRTRLSSVPLDSGAFVNRKVQERYDQWDWNFGRSPRFQLDLPLKSSRLVVEVIKGTIVSLNCEPADRANAAFLSALRGKRFSLEVFRTVGLDRFGDDLDGLLF